MEKIDTRTPDVTEENIEKLIELFPQVATEVENSEGEAERAIDFDALRDLLGDVAEGQRERYQFTWPGKREAKAEARRPIDKTMIPCPEKSVDWDTTENLYIEGDNLDALKLLKEIYAGKIKLIYIDPPYNTGHDLIYDDDFTVSSGDYTSGEYSDEGCLVANPESSGRFHSDWCTMMYPRLLLAKDLLRSDGAIFVSIDDNEAVNLEKMMDELFGRDSFVCRFAVVNNLKGRNDKANYAPCHESLYCYSKRDYVSYGLPLSLEKEEEYNKFDTAGNRYQLRDLRKRGNGDKRSDRPNMFFPIYYSVETNKCSLEPSEDAIEIIPKLSNGEDGRWRWGRDTVLSNLEILEPKRKRDGSWGVDYRVYLDPSLNPTSQSDGDERREKPKSIWMGPEFSSDVAQRELKDLFDNQTVFDFPKSLSFLKRIVEIGSRGDDIILDFFSGSGGLAQAVFLTNESDHGARKFILVQIPEASSGDYSTLCDIGEERIRRAGEKITNEIEAENQQLKLGEDPKPLPDIGFRVLRIDSSNFKDTYQAPDQAEQASLLDVIDNVKEGRTAEDILFQVLPAFRIPYSAHIDTFDVQGKKVFDVNYGQLLACFDVDVTNDVIEEIARRKPSYAVMRDLSFEDDSASANFEELFKTFSPDTIRRVI